MAISKIVTNSIGTSAVNLPTQVTGVLPVANGGTGTSTGVAPGGSTTQVQYNNAGAFGGDSGFVYTGGSVGIGTASPGDRLHVYQNSAYVGIKLQNQTSFLTFQMNDGIGAGNAVIYKDGPYATSFYNNGSEVGRFASGGNFSFNSGYGSPAVAYGCRAWVNFNGSDGSIRASGNISSVTKFGTGQYRANFSSSMPDTNYSVSTTGQYTYNGSTDGRYVIGSPANSLSTTFVGISCLNASDTAVIDPIVYLVAVFR